MSVFKNKEELNVKINVYLQNIYPSQYGECYQYSSHIADSRNCLHGLQNSIYRGVTDSTFTFYESLFEEKVIFRLRSFFLQYFIASDYSLWDNVWMYKGCTKNRSVIYVQITDRLYLKPTLGQ